MFVRVGSPHGAVVRRKVDTGKERQQWRGGEPEIGHKITWHCFFFLKMPSGKVFHKRKLLLKAHTGKMYFWWFSSDLSQYYLIFLNSYTTSVTENKSNWRKCWCCWCPHVFTVVIISTASVRTCADLHIGGAVCLPIHNKEKAPSAIQCPVSRVT